MGHFIAALFTGGKVVTGGNHGEAFCKLTRLEREGSINSGFLDPQTGRFITEDDHQFYIKRIVLLRHAEACDFCYQCPRKTCKYKHSSNPTISEFGRLQCEKAANFIIRTLPYHKYVGFCCDCKRVYATASSVFGQIGLPLQISNRFCDPFPGESVDAFTARIQEVIESLPENSIIVSHSDFVVNIAQVAMGTDITKCEQWKNKIPNCSITYIENHHPIWIGESPI